MLSLWLCTITVHPQIDDGGYVHLLNETLLADNLAPRGHGASVYLSSGAALLYTLPAPPGRFLFIQKGTSFELEHGAVDTDFPKACPAGVVGSTYSYEQTSSECSRPW